MQACTAKAQRRKAPLSEFVVRKIKLFQVCCAVRLLVLLFLFYLIAMRLRSFLQHLLPEISARAEKVSAAPRTSGQGDDIARDSDGEDTEDEDARPVKKKRKMERSRSDDPKGNKVKTQSSQKSQNKSKRTSKVAVCVVLSVMS